MHLIKLKKPNYYDFSESLYFLDRGYDDVLYEVNKQWVRKALIINNQIYLIQINEEGNNLIINTFREKVDISDEKIIKQFVTDWFDLERDLLPFYQKGEKTILAEMLNKFKGLRLVAIPDLFEALCWSIIGQQINLTFAYSLKRRLVELCDNKTEFEGVTYYTFPTPLQISQLTVDGLREKQFSHRKAEYLIGIASLFVEGSYSKEELMSLTTTQEMVNKLCQIRGIGEWSANYVLMKSLGRMDCITHGDTGLQAAVRKFMELDRKPTKEEVIQFLLPLGGWESYTVFYLWRSLSKN